MVEIHRVSFSYGDNEVLSDITFTWDTNELIYIWGPNGGGKTTLGYIISGLLMPKEGTIKRTDIGEEELLLMLQNPGDMVFTDNVITELAFGLENLGLNKNEMMRRIYWAMRTFELEKFAFESPQRLSGGELSLVVLASLIVMRPRFLILDEPFAHLDWFGRTRIFSALNTIREESSISVLEFGLKKEPSFEASKVYYLNKTLFDSHDEERSEIINIDFPVPGEPIAKLSDLFYIYKGKSKPAICGVDFTINEGEGIGIIGMNGAGKTTLGRLIAGIIKPSKG
ncbi:MAG: ATP-binding cassette domain-containing protein, partial [bacterium]